MSIKYAINNINIILLERDVALTVMTSYIHTRRRYMMTAASIAPYRHHLSERDGKCFTCSLQKLKFFKCRILNFNFEFFYFEDLLYYDYSKKHMLVIIHIQICCIYPIRSQCYMYHFILFRPQIY